MTREDLENVGVDDTKLDKPSHSAYLVKLPLPGSAHGAACGAQHQRPCRRECVAEPDDGAHTRGGWFGAKDEGGRRRIEG